ncbi:MAG: 3-deoxy-manno-octulosonate cytidylyltransferase [Selenomonadaceae bacterium]
MRVLCVIPARYDSTRLPGKPLADIAGKPMIQRVYERAATAKMPELVVVATDDARVLAAMESFGGKALMTAKDHPTGTDRLAEVAGVYDNYDVIINVQGDEPLIAPEIIDALAAAFTEEPELKMATVMTEIENAEKNNPNNVKVVTDKNGYALYFSRSLIPYPRTAGVVPVYKHIGIYAYRRDFLLAYAKMQPTPLEQSESLEQLRALENGYRIKVIKTDCKFVGVDTPEDLARVNAIYKEIENK